MFEQTVLDNKTLLCIIFCRYHDELISNGLLVPLSGTIEGDKNSDVIIKISNGQVWVFFSGKYKFVSNVYR
jgi:hypothetical protein